MATEYKSEAQYLYENPDVAAAVIAGDFESGFDHYKAFGSKEDRTPAEDRVYVDPQVAALQQQLADFEPVNVTQGGSSSTYYGPTQAEMIKAFQDAQDTSGIMSAIGTGTTGVDTPATGLYRPLEGLQAQVGQSY